MNYDLSLYQDLLNGDPALFDAIEGNNDIDPMMADLFETDTCKDPSLEIYCFKFQVKHEYIQIIDADYYQCKATAIMSK